MQRKCGEKSGCYRSLSRASSVVRPPLEHIVKQWLQPVAAMIVTHIQSTQPVTAKFASTIAPCIRTSNVCTTFVLENYNPRQR